ncbi:MAG: hypothetical protein U0U70_09495 [Chitinophagaceae bacterium]
MSYTEETLKTIYTSQHDRFQHTRTNLWKINITFWTLLVLAIFYKDKLPINNNWLIVLIGFILFGLHFLFVLTVQKNLETDKRIWLSIIKYWNDEWPKDIRFKIDTTGIKLKSLRARAWFWIVFSVCIVFVISNGTNFYKKLI